MKEIKPLKKTDCYVDDATLKKVFSEYSFYEFKIWFKKYQEKILDEHTDNIFDEVVCAINAIKKDNMEEDVALRLREIKGLRGIFKRNSIINK